MMENPAFDENVLQKSRTVYKNVKPKIDREKCKEIPGIQELWAEIDKLEEIFKVNNAGGPFSKEIPKLSNHNLYLLKHHLIELRTQQYYLVDSYFPTIQLQHSKSEFHPDVIDFQGNYPVLPRGVMREEHDVCFEIPRRGRMIAAYEQQKIWTDEEIENLEKKNKVYFDFRKPEHLYQLILNYWDIKAEIKGIPHSPLYNLLWTLDFYVGKAKLSEQQRFIIDCKKKRMQNREIVVALKEKLGINHQENYISTIWNKSLGLIAEAVELNYDEWLCRDYERAWKCCNRCGRELLRDERNFVKKAKAADGLTNRCKCCDKDVRNGR